MAYYPIREGYYSISVVVGRQSGIEGEATEERLCPLLSFHLQFISIANNSLLYLTFVDLPPWHLYPNLNIRNARDAKEDTLFL